MENANIFRERGAENSKRIVFRHMYNGRPSRAHAPALRAAGAQAGAARAEAREAQRQLQEVCHYMIQPLVELYGGCMVVLKVS